MLDRESKVLLAQYSVLQWYDDFRSTGLEVTTTIQLEYHGGS